MASNKTHFDLHVYGIGYVNSIREVPVTKGQNFWACNLSAIHGDKNDIHYTNFDICVSGIEALRCIKKLQTAETGKKKILVGFKLGDLHADLFTYAHGPKKGETGVNLKARLLVISWAKVDGKIIYKAPASQKQKGLGSHEDDSLAA
jgi:hypothetical protein